MGSGRGGMRSALAAFVVWMRPLRTFAVMLADRVTSRQIERVDHMEGRRTIPNDSRGISAVNRFVLMV